MDFGIKITIKDPDDFLVIRETLTRIGIPSNKTKTLTQTAHILHKRGDYYILHFKEMFALDQKPSTITEEDIQRRNLIAKLMQDWGLIEVIDAHKIETVAPITSVKVLSYKDKDYWTLVEKYQVGSKSKH